VAPIATAPKNYPYNQGPSYGSANVGGYSPSAKGDHHHFSITDEGAGYASTNKPSYGDSNYKKGKKEKSSGEGGSYPITYPNGGYNPSSGMAGTGTFGYQPPQQTSNPGQSSNGGYGGGSPTGSSSLPQPTSGSPGNGSVISSGGISLSAGCGQKNGIGIGRLPSDVSLSTIESTLGFPAYFDGQYAQITTEGTYTDSDSQLLGHLSDISVAG